MRIIRSLAIAAVLLASSAGNTAGAADLPVVNVISLPSSTSGEVYYAQDMGFFKDAGIDVHITPMTSSPAIISALVSGSADIGFAAIGVGASARDRGIPVWFVAPGPGMARTDRASRVSPHVLQVICAVVVHPQLRCSMSSGSLPSP